MALLSLLSPDARAAPPRRVGLIHDRSFLEHWLRNGHPESPARYEAIINAFERSGLLREVSSLALPPEMDIKDALLAIHTRWHIAEIERLYGRSHEIALNAVAAGLLGVDAVCGGAQDSVFCAVRPPGHHALNSGRDEGFCLYNNVAVAARYAQKVYRRDKILIVDWDYHHGNATEAAFYDDPTVLFFSTHDRYAYPGTGDPLKTGAGKGDGYNVNVHLDCGADDAAIISAFHDHLLPAAHRFRPDLILISAGFDSRTGDLLGCFEISDDGFARLTRIVRELADEYCDGCLVSLLEGGYTPSGLASAVVTHVRALLSG